MDEVDDNQLMIGVHQNSRDQPIGINGFQNNTCHVHATLAQLVEQITHNDSVIGSSPMGRNPNTQ